MWLLMNDSYLSVVAHRDQPDSLLVRSRIAGDIERALPGAVVFELEDADYRYRAVVPRERFKEALGQAVDRIDYPNFKNSVKDPSRHDAYFQVWKVLVDRFGAYRPK